MVFLGILQAFTTGLHLYNSSEENHEHQEGGRIYVNIAPAPDKKFWRNTNTQDVSTYFVKNSQDINQALATLPHEKSQKIQVRIDEAQSVAQDSKSDAFSHILTPVNISVLPKKSTMPRGYMWTITKVLQWLYFRDVLWSFPLIVDRDRVSPRGQVTNETLTLSGRIKTLPEVAKVLVHELGHMVDIYLIRGSAFRLDSSKLYYAISWSEPTVMMAGQDAEDFVSGYAATNQYEDFAEAFTMYIFHNKEFAKRAEKNPILAKKYAYLTTYIFGDMFLWTSYEQDDIPKEFWDVTKIAISDTELDAVFAFLGRFYS
jgi:hypothetical protein